MHGKGFLGLHLDRGVCSWLVLGTVLGALVWSSAVCLADDPFTVSIASIPDSTIYPTQDVALTAEVHGSPDLPLTYKWEKVVSPSTGNFTEDDTQPTTKFKVNSPQLIEEQPVQLRVTVRDASEQEASADVYLTCKLPPAVMVSCQEVLGNGAIHRKALKVVSGGTLALTATASGGTGPYTYTWSPTDYLSNSGVGQTMTFTPPASPASSYSYTVTALDSQSQSIQGSCTIEVAADADGFLADAYDRVDELYDWMLADVGDPPSPEDCVAHYTTAWDLYDSEPSNGFSMGDYIWQEPTGWVSRTISPKTFWTNVAEVGWGQGWYFLSQVVHPQLNMYEATGDADTYLSFAKDVADKMLLTKEYIAPHISGHNYEGWPEGRGDIHYWDPDPENLTESPLCELQGGRMLTRLARLMAQRGDLYESYSAYVDCARDDILEKWNCNGAVDSSAFESNLETWGFEKAVFTTCMYLDLWHATGESIYRTRAERVIQVFKGSFLNVDVATGSYWSLIDSNTQSGYLSGYDIQSKGIYDLDTSHANRLADMAYWAFLDSPNLWGGDACRFTDIDIDRLTRTFLVQIFNGTADAPYRMNQFITGINPPFAFTDHPDRMDWPNTLGYIGSGWQYMGLLGEHARKVVDVFGRGVIGAAPGTCTDFDGRLQTDHYKPDVCPVPSYTDPDTWGNIGCSYNMGSTYALLSIPSACLRALVKARNADTGTLRESVQAAVGEVEGGETIVVLPGTHHEHLTMPNKAIDFALQSLGAQDWRLASCTVIDGGEDDPAIAFQTDKPNIRLDSVTIRGQGTVSAAKTLTNNGRVVADGYGNSSKVLDLRAMTVTNTVDNPTDGTNGWYATGKGSLLLPAISVSSTGTYNWGEAPYGSGTGEDETIDLVNSVQIEVTTAPSSSAQLDIALLAADRDEPVHAAEVPAIATIYPVLGIWKFSTSTGQVTGNLTIRYDHTCCGAAGGEFVLAVASPVDGEWQLLGADWTALDVNLDGYTCSKNGVVFGIDTVYLALIPKFPGDSNLDGGVDVVDLLNLVAAFGSIPGDANYDPTCDFNADDSVDVVDLLDLVANFGTYAKDRCSGDQMLSSRAMVERSNTQDDAEPIWWQILEDAGLLDVYLDYVAEHPEAGQ